jgi:hypothetical protein
MKPGSSASWREDGDATAYDHEIWEFKSRQFSSSAKQLLTDFDAAVESLNFESIMLLPTAEFLASLAVELVAKAYYLRLNSGPREAIYRHDVLDLCGDSLFSPEQRQLMLHAQRYVVWAGRYPTPKWTRETFKEEYDVPSTIAGRVETIDATNIPNTASPPRVDELLTLHHHIQDAWARLGGA